MTLIQQMELVALVDWQIPTVCLTRHPFVYPLLTGLPYARPDLQAQSGWQRPVVHFDSCIDGRSVRRTEVHKNRGWSIGGD